MNLRDGADAPTALLRVLALPALAGTATRRGRRDASGSGGVLAASWEMLKKQG